MINVGFAQRRLDCVTDLHRQQQQCLDCTSCMKQCVPLISTCDAISNVNTLPLVSTDQEVGAAYRAHIAAQQLVQVLDREAPRTVVIKHLKCSADPLIPLHRLLQQNAQLHRFRARSPRNDFMATMGEICSCSTRTCTSFQSISAAILRCRQLRLSKKVAAPGKTVILPACCGGSMVTKHATHQSA